MGQKFAAYNAQGVITAFYDSVDSPPPTAVEVIELTDVMWLTCIQTPGYTVVSGQLVAPTPPTEAEVAQLALEQSARTALASGLQVTSTGTSAINGTYAVDQLSQADIVAIETSLNAGKGFPGGATTFSYPDATGALHAFSESNFTDFAAAVRDFVYGCKAVISGQVATVPSSAVTIA